MIETRIRCLNCSAELHGRFCHACGQKVAATQLAFKDVVQEASEEFLHLDSKIINTVKTLLTKPGLLTKEFVAGRRARYVPPLRLYIGFSVLYFFLLAFVPGAREQAIKVNLTDGDVKTQVTSGPMYERFVDSLVQILPNVVLVFTLPALAILTYAFFRKRQSYFVAHLYYSLHLHAVVFLGLSIATLFGALGGVGRIPSSLVAVALVPYYFIATRRFFDVSWTNTLVKGSVVALLYITVLLLSMLAVIMIIIRTGNWSGPGY